MRVVPDAPVHTKGIDLDDVVAGGHPTLVVFETPGCEPCRRLLPLLEAVAHDYRGRALVVRVDASAGWLAARHHLAYVPTLTFWAGGEEQARIRGNPGEEAVRRYMDFLIRAGERPDSVSGSSHALTASFSGRRSREGPRALLVGRAKP